VSNSADLIQEMQIKIAQISSDVEKLTKFSLNPKDIDSVRIEDLPN
jgi:hypothetical protein